MDLVNVLIKSSERCPLSCRYCYEGKKDGRLMSIEVAKRLFEIVQGHPDLKKISYIWHGAEPMALGIDFFRNALEHQKNFRTNATLSNGMQSSGVMLNPEIADFLINSNISVGFSLDGPRKVHNQSRVYYDGSGSFDEVMRAVNLMKERDSRVGVISVLSRLSLDHIDDIYNFFREEDLDFKINPIVNCGFARENPFLDLSPREKADAICYLFDRWFFDEPEEGRRKISYGNVESIARSMFTKFGGSCDSLPNCQTEFIGFDIDGNFLPCSRFSKAQICYGNAFNVKNFSDVLDNTVRQKILERHNKNYGCQSCRYDSLCYSGCMHNSFLSGNLMARDPNCLSNMIVYEHISSRILNELKESGSIIATNNNVDGGGFK